MQLDARRLHVRAVRAGHDGEGTRISAFAAILVVVGEDGGGQDNACQHLRSRRRLDPSPADQAQLRQGHGRHFVAQVNLDDGGAVPTAGVGDHHRHRDGIVHPDPGWSLRRGIAPRRIAETEAEGEGDAGVAEGIFAGVAQGTLAVMTGNGTGGERQREG